MFVTLVGAILTFFQLFTSKEPFGYVLQIASGCSSPALRKFAEAVAEGRGKAQARALRDSRRQLVAHRRRKDGSFEQVDATDLRKGDVVRSSPASRSRRRRCRRGAASVDESAITGESAPVIREAGGDRCAVTGGTRVLSDQLLIRITRIPARASSIT